MPRTADIRDPAFRAALEKAEGQLDDGAYAQAAQTCVETYLELLARHPELLPADTPDLPRSAAGPNGVSSFDSARAIRRKWWPVTGAITVVLGRDRTPQVTHVKDRVSMTEAAGYFEFVMEQVADTER